MVGGGVFFFSSRRRHTRFDCDWSSDVCSSDLPALGIGAFAEKTLVAAGQCTPVPATKPEVAGLLGCGVMAGLGARSEERRVGKECSSRWSARDHKKKVSGAGTADMAAMPSRRL